MKIRYQNLTHPSIQDGPEWLNSYGEVTGLEDQAYSFPSVQEAYEERYGYDGYDDDDDDDDYFFWIGNCLYKYEETDDLCRMWAEDEG